MTDEIDGRGADRATLGTVLVVDDSVATRRILSRSLTGGGYRVREAGNGQEALDSCRAELPDIVLLDIDMPVMDGLTTVREMKDDPELRSLPVLFLTARTGGDDVVVGLGLGAQDYLRKPCEPAELCARVGAALRIKAHGDLLQRQARALDELSTTDTLTSLGNRRRLEVRLEQLARERDGGAAVGALIVDVDHFKRVNDQEGHAVGDIVLRIVAERLRAATGEQHILVRWGGEEFVIVALDVGAADTAALGERARHVVGGSPISIGDGRTLTVTASVGGALGRLDDVAAVLRSADEALYAAKAAGRNRVVVSSR
jgi:two-component system cell cycle response regulator